MVWAGFPIALRVLRGEDAAVVAACHPGTARCDRTRAPGQREKRCGEACPDIDLASDAAFKTAQKFQDKYWKGTQMNDVEKR